MKFFDVMTVYHHSECRESSESFLMSSNSSLTGLVSLMPQVMHDNDSVFVPQEKDFPLSSINQL